MIRKVLGLAGVLAALAACNSLPYKDDIGFLVSSQANAAEFPVYVNGKLCTDTEGWIGLCAKRIKSTEDVSLRIDPQVYGYLLTVNCSNGVKPPLPATVPANQPFELVIKAADFSQFLVFTCAGEVSPQDRNPPISAKFRVTFSVYDTAYVPREAILSTKMDGKNVLVLGQYAREAWVFDEGRWSNHAKDTIVELRGDPAKAKAYSSSFAMRFNFLNMGSADGPVH